MSTLQNAHALGFAAVLGAQAGAKTRFGWTAPTIIYEEMRAVDQDAMRLDGNVQAYAPDPVFRAAWNAWFGNWRAFLHRYLDSNAEKLGAVFYTDDLARQVETYRQQLAGLYVDYSRQRQISGAPVPPLSPPALVAPPLVPGQTTSPTTGQPEKSLVPWWGWMLLGVGVVGGLWYGWRRTQKRFGWGPYKEEGPSAARDAGPGKTLADYAADPRAYVVYSPPPSAASAPPPQLPAPAPRSVSYGYAPPPAFTPYEPPPLQLGAYYPEDD